MTFTVRTPAHTAAGHRTRFLGCPPLIRTSISRVDRSIRSRLAPVAFKPPDKEEELAPGEKSAVRSVDTDTCQVYTNKAGEIIEVMCFDYGFRSGTGRLYQDNYGNVPSNIFQLASKNFGEELRALRLAARYAEMGALDKQPPEGWLAGIRFKTSTAAVRAFRSADGWMQKIGWLKELEEPGLNAQAQNPDGSLSSDAKQLLSQLKQLKLDNEAVWVRERARLEVEGDYTAPFPVKAAYYLLCWILDVIYDGRPIQRFWVLEEVARMPYFAYISMIHLYESLGWWRAGAELRKVHFAEEWNELHHLQIMESLGGDLMWMDRFVAQHAALVYYWGLILMYALSPRLSYNFSEMVESHASDTYSEFVEENAELLKTLPPPLVAVEYYKGEDLYMFDNFMTGKKETPRRPPCDSLFDTFCNIRDDEIEHKKTMVACQDQSIASDIAAQASRLSVDRNGTGKP